MTLCEYNYLDQTAQFETLYNHGIHISDRADTEHCIILFQLHSFYVELYFHIEHNSLKKFRSFSNMDYIKPYLEQIDLSELVIETLK
ncbi:MAG: hypothetical protein ABIN97_03745 [Ginsengibacter sp.]